MEKWMVIAGVWAMCATCAILFIRGASSSAARTVPVKDSPGRDARGFIDAQRHEG
jgi:hypothetical protein